MAGMLTTVIRRPPTAAAIISRGSALGYRPTTTAIATEKWAFRVRALSTTGGSSSSSGGGDDDASTPSMPNFRPRRKRTVKPPTLSQSKFARSAEFALEEDMVEAVDRPNPAIVPPANRIKALYRLPGLPADEGGEEEEVIRSLDGLYEADPDDELEMEFGPDGAEALRHARRQLQGGLSAASGAATAGAAGGEGVSAPAGQGDDIESYLRMSDYLTSPPGSTADLIDSRRALAMDSWSDEERESFPKELQKLIEEERVKSYELGEDDMTEVNPDAIDAGKVEEDPNKEAHGPWSQTIVRVDRVQKVQRGGTMVRYRALIIGGNGNGVAGYGIGKANSPNEATVAASRMCKRNIYFVDRYLGNGLTSDLAGRHNSCKVALRSVTPGYGLRGHPLVTTILKYFGITDCTAKTHGNRNIYGVVRATFKAVMTHEGIEDIALKRGRKMLNLDRAMRLQI